MRLYRELSNKNAIEIRLRSNSRREENEPQFTFKMVFNGCQSFKFKGRAIKLFPDSFILLAPGSVYSSATGTGDAVKTLSVSIANSFISAFKEQHGLGGAFLDQTAQGCRNLSLESVHPLAEEMYWNGWTMCQRVEELNDDAELMNEYINHFLEIYYKNYYTEYEHRLQRLNFTRNDTRREVLRRLNIAREFISNNFDRTFYLRDVASASFLSFNHLLRTFKQAFGVSPFQYLTIIRLNRAKMILETTPRSINEIVLEVGFESPSSFIRAFKSQFNITPMRYRKTLTPPYQRLD
jgi:AraC-like DNA-binding protein